MISKYNFDDQFIQLTIFLKLAIITIFQLFQNYYCCFFKPIKQKSANVSVLIVLPQLFTLFGTISQRSQYCLSIRYFRCHFKTFFFSILASAD